MHSFFFLNFASYRHLESDTQEEIPAPLIKKEMKTAIVIGATSGLGREVAAGLAARGWKVGIAGRREERLQELRGRFGEEMMPCRRMDVTDASAAAVLDELMGETGAPDLLFYASGIGFQNPKLDEGVEMDIVRTNCEGMVRIVDHFVNYVKAHPDIYRNDHRAHIAVISSVAGTAGLGAAPAYSATKKMQSTYISALVQLSRMEKIPVDFTDIRPGFVRTEILNPDKPYPFVLEPQEAGRLILKALEKRKRIFIFDWKFRLVVLFWRSIPRWLWERLSIVRN